MAALLNANIIDNPDKVSRMEAAVNGDGDAEYKKWIDDHGGMIVKLESKKDDEIRKATLFFVNTPLCAEDAKNSKILQCDICKVYYFPGKYRECLPMWGNLDVVWMYPRMEGGEARFEDTMCMRCLVRNNEKYKISSF